MYVSSGPGQDSYVELRVGDNWQEDQDLGETSL